MGMNDAEVHSQAKRLKNGFSEIGPFMESAAAAAYKQKRQGKTAKWKQRKDGPNDKQFENELKI